MKTYKLTEKEMKIVAAVNRFQCEVYKDKVLAELIKKEPDYLGDKVGDMFFVGPDFNEAYYKLVWDVGPLRGIRQ